MNSCNGVRCYYASSGILWVSVFRLATVLDLWRELGTVSSRANHSQPAHTCFRRGIEKHGNVA